MAVITSCYVLQLRLHCASYGSDYIMLCMERLLHCAIYGACRDFMHCNEDYIALLMLWLLMVIHAI